ncbi:hypothetical protein MK163_08080 [bacterium]|nr:hypothetical protein [bacterium]
MPLDIAVQIEEEIQTFAPADNGAGPLWCHGSTIVARRGDAVYVAALETLPDQVPLNNCRFLLYRRNDDGWALVYRDTTGRTREPSPVVLLGGQLLVSANPTHAAPGEYGGAAAPAVFRFDTADPEVDPVREKPVWRDEPPFSEHSYRTVVADGHEVLYLQNTGYEKAHASFRDEAGNWRDLPPLVWPQDDTSDQPLRLCYPNVVLHNRSAHFLGVGDIVEPVAAWKDAKREITGRKWDYVFRRLFYAHTPDIANEPFGKWIELADLDQTAGHIANGDLHLDANGIVHALWTQTSVDHRLRDRFFPGEQIIRSLEYLTLKEGQIQAQRTLVRHVEDADGPVPHLARFHVLADGTLLILGQFTGVDSGTTYRIAEINDDHPEWIDIPFKHPMSGIFLTNTIRNGSSPSSYIDIVGMSPTKPHTLGYARVEIGD